MKLIRVPSGSAVVILALTLAMATVQNPQPVGAQLHRDTHPGAPPSATDGSLPTLGDGPAWLSCAFCTDCGHEGDVGNIAWDPTLPLAINEVGSGLHPDSCYLTGGCSVQHPSTCSGGFEDQEDFAAAVNAITELKQLRSVMLWRPTAS